MPYHSHTDNLLSLLFPMDVTSLSIFHDSTFYFILSTSLIMIYSYYILSIHLRKNDNYRLYLVANFLNRFLFSISRNWLCSNWCFLLPLSYCYFVVSVISNGRYLLIKISRFHLLLYPKYFSNYDLFILYTLHTL